MITTPVNPTEYNPYSTRNRNSDMIEMRLSDNPRYYNSIARWLADYDVLVESLYEKLQLNDWQLLYKPENILFNSISLKRLMGALSGEYTMRTNYGRTVPVKTDFENLERGIEVAS